MDEQSQHNIAPLLAAQNQWKTMDTAPKDGTPIIVMVMRASDFYELRMTRWVEKADYWWEMVDEETQKRRTETLRFWDGIFGRVGPCCWMPCSLLPLPFLPYEPDGLLRPYCTETL